MYTVSQGCLDRLNHEATAQSTPAHTGRSTDKAKKVNAGRSGTPTGTAAPGAMRVRNKRRSDEATSHSGKYRRLTVMLRRVICSASGFPTVGTSNSLVRAVMKPGMTKTSTMTSASAVPGIARVALLLRRWRGRGILRRLRGTNCSLCQHSVFAHACPPLYPTLDESEYRVLAGRRNVPDWIQERTRTGQLVVPAICRARRPPSAGATGPPRRPGLRTRTLRAGAVAGARRCSSTPCRCCCGPR